MDESYPRVVCNNPLLLLNGTRVKRRIFGPEARVSQIDMDCPISCKRSMRSRRWRSTPPVAKRPATTFSTLLTNHRSIVFFFVERRLSLRFWPRGTIDLVSSGELAFPFFASMHEPCFLCVAFTLVHWLDNK